MGATLTTMVGLLAIAAGLALPVDASPAPPGPDLRLELDPAPCRFPAPSLDFLLLGAGDGAGGAGGAGAAGGATPGLAGDLRPSDPFPPAGDLALLASCLAGGPAGAAGPSADGHCPQGPGRTIAEWTITSYQNFRWTPNGDFELHEKKSLARLHEMYWAPAQGACLKYYDLTFSPLSDGWRRFLCGSCFRLELEAKPGFGMEPA